MSKEYIERGALLEHIEEELAFCKNPCPENNPIAYGCELGLKCALSFIKTAPAADVAPVVHGKWRLNKDGSGTCNQCHFTQKNVWDMDRWQRYCGVCGALMDGGFDNEHS